MTTHLPKEDITMTDLELRLGYLIHDVSRLRRTLFDKWLSPLGITRSQWWVLAFLSRNDGMPQTELALMILDVGKVALGALIDRLEESGFVKRVPDKSDRRVKRVVLTKQSKEVVETLREKSSEFNQSILSDIDPRPSRSHRRNATPDETQPARRGQTVLAHRAGGGLRQRGRQGWLQGWWQG